MACVRPIPYQAVEYGVSSIRAVALVVSARENGNCSHFAQFVLGRLRASGEDTELVNFYDWRITPCQRCAYECLQNRYPQGRVSAPCPIEDDVRAVWEKTWHAEILLLFVPTYGGFPPALWFAFSQRVQAFFREAPLEKLKRSVVSAVLVGAPHLAGGAQWLPSIMADEIKGLDREVACFEVINSAGFETRDSFGGLIEEAETQRRLAFMAERTLQKATQVAGAER